MYHFDIITILSYLLTAVDIIISGFNDNVKCFYCDGGLRNWETGDVPWEEHARWFPKCPFVLQVKGQEFINGILCAKGGEMAVVANAQRSSVSYMLFCEK